MIQTQWNFMQLQTKMKPWHFGGKLTELEIITLLEISQIENESCILHEEPRLTLRVCIYTMCMYFYLCACLNMCRIIGYKSRKGLMRWEESRE